MRTATVCATGSLAALILLSGIFQAGADDKPKEGAAGFTEVKVFGGCRIPVIVLTGKGTLLAFAEKRHASSDHGPVDLIVSRSSDLGKTWSKPQMIHGGFKYACGNPCPIVDRDNGTVWLLFARNNNRQIMLTHSKDDGQTWAEPKALTEESKPEAKDGWQATGPNQGIQLASGRLLAPANAGGRSCCFYSDDHGATWKRGESIDTPSSECVAVELMDGSVVLNVRDKRQRKENKNRASAISKDGGQTWSKAEIHAQLLGPECNHCQVRLSDEKRHDKNRLLHSGPMGPDGRKNLTLYLSYDEAKTWQQAKVVHPGRDASYTGLVVLPDQSIGLLYETNSTGWQSIWFARFTLEWLTDGKDRVASRDVKK